MTCAPSENKDQPGHSWVWSESLLCTQWIAKDTVFLHADSELWSDWVNAQADLNLRWAHRSFYWFCCAVAQMSSIMTKPIYTICEQQRCKSACVLHSLKFIFVILYRSTLWISRLKLASVAEQTCLRFTWVHISYDRFSHDMAQVGQWVLIQWKNSLMSMRTKPSEPPHDKTNRMTCVPSKDSDQPGHSPSLIRFAVRMKKDCVLSYPLRAQRRLIRLGGCWAHMSLRWAHMPFCWFCHAAAHLAYCPQKTQRNNCVHGELSLKIKNQKNQ